jgi:hypothetical protein
MGDDEAPDPKAGDGTAAPKPTSKRRKDKEALPFAEDSERLDGRAWNRKPLVVLGVVIAVVVVIVLLVLAFNNVTADDSDDGGGNAPPPVQTTTSTAPTTTSTTSTTTTSTTAPPPTTEALPTNACSPEEGDPDCIDPDGDGDYQLLQGGASCLATAETPRDCIDTNHDGAAGPPATAD